MTQAHLKQGHLTKALQMLRKLEQQGYKNCPQTYVCLLQGCIQSNALYDGRFLHDHIIRSEWRPNVFISTSIVNMYARCGDIEDAQAAFDNMIERNQVTWNMMIAAYCRHERFEDALNTFWGMQEHGVTPNDVSFVSGFKACAGLGNLEKGRQVHDLFRKSKMKPSTLVGNSLVNMYIKCGSFEDAQQNFDTLDKKDSASWNVIIGGYVKNGDAKKALTLFSEMQSMHIKPDIVTFLSISNAYGNLGDFEQAKKIHNHIMESGLELNTLMRNALIDMYTKCRGWSSAWKVFDEIPERDVSTWNAMVGGLTKHGHCEEAFQLFYQMAMEGFYPNDVSYVSILTACTTLQASEQGKRIHCRISKTNASTNIFIANALVEMYATCGSLSSSCKLFNEMLKRNVVSWNTIIAVHVKHGLDQEALQLFQKMIQEGIDPDEITYVSVVNVCANLTSVFRGFQVHSCIVISQYDHDLFVGNALIDMYAKCGKLKDANRVLYRMPEKDIVSWNTMLAGYAQHGVGQEVVSLAGTMLHEGMELNHVSFVAILSACSHAGLVDEGWYYFIFMMMYTVVEHAIEHYGCMIDLLARCGRFYEAEGLLKHMPLESSSVLWRALLGACRIHGNVELAINAAAHILRLEPNDSAVLLLISNVYALDDECLDETMTITITNNFDKHMRSTCDYV